MSLKASQLKTNETQKKAITKEVTPILARFDEELLEARKQGMRGVALTAPITFSIPYMSNAEAQRSIYYTIMTSLIDREFYVEIELDKDKSTFHVKWLTDDESKEIEVQNALIAKFTRKKR